MTILMGTLAVIVTIACASVTALTWILIGEEIGERRRKHGRY